MGQGDGDGYGTSHMGWGGRDRVMGTVLGYPIWRQFWVALMGTGTWGQNWDIQHGMRMWGHRDGDESGMS